MTLYPVPDLSYRFDDHTEEHNDQFLKRIREFARNRSLPQNLIVEIGSNRGRFLAAMAERHPDRFALGIEYRPKFTEIAKRRLARRGLDNAEILTADANLVFPILIDDGQIGDIFIPFPDPWWKRKHRKRRIIQPEFLDLLARKMKDDGRVWIRTDVGPLADDMQATLDAHPDFEPLGFDEIPTEPLPRTTRERNIINEKIPIHLLYYRRRPRD